MWLFFVFGTLLSSGITAKQEDLHSKCAQWTRFCQHHAHKHWMATNCASTCREEEKDQDSSDDSSDDSSGKLSDKSPRCKNKGWKAYCYQPKYEEWMLHNCARLCSTVTRPEPVDLHKNCPNWKKHCSHRVYKAWMSQNCQRTCSETSDPPTSLRPTTPRPTWKPTAKPTPSSKKDLHKRCKHWTRFCSKRQHKKWMKANCAKTCQIEASKGNDKGKGKGAESPTTAPETSSPTARAVTASPTSAPVTCQAGQEVDTASGTCVNVSCQALNACPSGSTCVATNIVCVRSPCPQFRCVDPTSSPTARAVTASPTSAPISAPSAAPDITDGRGGGGDSTTTTIVTAAAPTSPPKKGDSGSSRFRRLLSIFPRR